MEIVVTTRAEWSTLHGVPGSSRVKIVDGVPGGGGGGQGKQSPRNPFFHFQNNCLGTQKCNVRANT